MKSLSLAVMVLGTLMFDAACAQANWAESASTAAIAANESVVISVHGSHTACVFGKAFPTWLQDSWHKHPGGNMFFNASCQPPAPPPTTKKGTLDPSPKMTTPPTGPKRPEQTR
jgi:hypothetical protein